MRIIWLSNAPYASTGYGNQTRLFVPRLQAQGHEMGIIAFWGLEGGILNWNGVTMYPKGYHPYGVDVMSAHAAHYKADLLLTLLDAWVIDPRMITPGLRWAAWFPVDHEPIPPAVREKVRSAYARIVYSRFAEAQVQNAGMDCVYIPHGVDTEIFTLRDGSEARERLGWPGDKFIVGMVAANKGNPSRKAFTQNIAAFAELKRKHSDVMLYLHTVADESNQGVNLPEFVQSLGLSFGFMGNCDPKNTDVVFCDQYANLLGFPDTYMSNVYNGMDVLLSVSMGEGFGIPILEAQACSTPVIVGDWTSMPELCFGGWKIPKADAEAYWTPLAAYQYIPHTGAIFDALKIAYRKAGNVEVRQRAREGALAYDADRVAEVYWRPALEAMQANIDAWKVPAEVEA